MMLGRQPLDSYHVPILQLFIVILTCRQQRLRRDRTAIGSGQLPPNPSDLQLTDHDLSSRSTSRNNEVQYFASHTTLCVSRYSNAECPPRLNPESAAEARHVLPGPFLPLSVAINLRRQDMHSMSQLAWFQLSITLFGPMHANVSLACSNLSNPSLPSLPLGCGRDCLKLDSTAMPKESQGRRTMGLHGLHICSHRCDMLSS